MKKKKKKKKKVLPEMLYNHNNGNAVSVCTMVLSVGLVEAFRVNEAQVVRVLIGQKVELGGAVGHQGIIAVAHPHVALQRC